MPFLISKLELCVQHVTKIGLIMIKGVFTAHHSHAAMHNAQWLRTVD